MRKPFSSFLFLLTNLFICLYTFYPFIYLTHLSTMYPQLSSSPLPNSSSPPISPFTFLALPLPPLLPFLLPPLPLFSLSASLYTYTAYPRLCRVRSQLRHQLVECGNYGNVLPDSPLFQAGTWPAGNRNTIHSYLLVNIKCACLQANELD